jgi:Patatin-like phospholipase
MTSIRFALSLVLSLVLVACASSYDRTNVTPTAETYERFYPSAASSDVRQFEDGGREALVTLQEYLKPTLAQVPRGRGLNILALSGGGQHGAYGAGVLNGWTTSGKRPDFDIVTGISTGSLIAPFAFLGSGYDARLKRFYTQTTTRDVARLDVAGAIFGRGFLGKTTPLRAAIERELTDDLITAIGAEHRKGRRLLVGTTNIDAERPVLWDIGQMAQIETPQARALIRDVILASAAIPVVFPPITIEVTDGDIRREELHVDGGLTREVFVYPPGLPMGQMLRQAGLSGRDNTIWLIHNKTLEPSFEPLPGNATAVADRAFEMLIRSQSIGNIESILSLAKRDGLGANITYIPRDFTHKPDEPFDRDYMNALFTVGHAAGSASEGWLYDIQDWTTDDFE